MIIGYWSMNHGTGTSAGAAAMAIMTAAKENRNVLLMQSNFKMNDLDYMLFGDDAEEIKASGKSIDHAISLYKQTQFRNIEDFAECIKPVTETLSVLPGTAQSEEETFGDRVSQITIARMIPALARHYDDIFIDTNSGFSPQTMEVLKLCDVIVVSMRQSPRMFEAFGEADPFPGKKVLFLLSDYRAASKFNLKNLERKYKIKNLAAIAESAGYNDAIAEGRAVRYIAGAGGEFLDSLMDAIRKLTSVTAPAALKYRRDADKGGQQTQGNTVRSRRDCLPVPIQVGGRADLRGKGETGIPAAGPAVTAGAADGPNVAEISEKLRKAVDEGDILRGRIGELESEIQRLKNKRRSHIRRAGVRKDKAAITKER